MKNELVPPEIKGKNTDLEETITLDTTDEAGLAFKRAYNRMLNPRQWHKLAGSTSAEFVLTNDHGEELHRLAKKGDHFKIDVPGPGSARGDGYDWVTVDMVEEIHNPGKDEESCGMKLRASAKPGEEGASAAHFFKEGATSSFVIHRKGNSVTASYHGRNEVPNTDTGKTIDNIRNSLVAIGALAGLSEAQWSLILKGLLSTEVTDL